RAAPVDRLLSEPRETPEIETALRPPRRNAGQGEGEVPRGRHSRKGQDRPKNRQTRQRRRPEEELVSKRAGGHLRVLTPGIGRPCAGTRGWEAPPTRSLKGRFQRAGSGGSSHGFPTAHRDHER